MTEDNKPRTTGQLIFRNAGRHPVNGDHLMMVIGIVALPEGVVKSEHQYVLSGSGDLSLLTVHLASEIDRTAETRGAGLGHLVILPIWRV